MKQRLITAYYLGRGHGTVVPRHEEENFRDMVDSGFTAVAMPFSQADMKYARRSFEIRIALARKCGLKCLVIPSRLGGRTAGSPVAPCAWLGQHLHCRVPEQTTPRLPIACLESEEFRIWAKDFMTTLVADYELDGIIWDEPKRVALISKHPDTIAKYGPNPTAEQMQDSFVDFLTALTAHCLNIKPALSVTLFAQKDDPPYFTTRAACIPGLDYFGYDGNLAPQSFFHEEPRWHKYRIESVWDRTISECASANKGTFALIENMLMPASAMPVYERNLENYLKTYRPDHLSIYYYGPNNEDPETVHRITRRLMRAYL